MDGQRIPGRVSCLVRTESRSGAPDVSVTVDVSVVLQLRGGTTLDTTALSQQVKERFMSELDVVLHTVGLSDEDVLAVRG